MPKTIQNSKESDNQIFDYTQGIHFFSGLPKKQRQEVAREAINGTKKKGEMLFAENDPVEGVFFIRSGKVKLSTSDVEGNERIIGIFVDSDMIWDGMYKNKSVYPYSAICVTAVDYCWISREILEGVIKDPEVSMRTIYMLSNKLHDANERNKILSTSDPTAKLAGFLLYRNRYTSQSLITLGLENIAASIHLRPETVSRKVKVLAEKGAIKRVGKTGLELVDLVLLQKIFDGTE